MDLRNNVEIQGKKIHGREVCIWNQLPFICAHTFSDCFLRYHFHMFFILVLVTTSKSFRKGERELIIIIKAHK